MGDDKDTTGEGFTEVALVLKDETLRHILTGQPLSEEQYAEVVNATISATGATGAETPEQSKTH